MSNIVVITLIGILGLLIVLFFIFVPIGLWISSLAANVKISIFNLIGMKLRRVVPSRIVLPLIKARKAGMNLGVNQLEAHYLAGGNVDNVVNALIASERAGIELPFEKAAAIDLAGRDVLEAVKMSVNPKVIETTNVSAVAKDGIELLVKARVTVRADLERLVGECDNLADAVSLFARLKPEVVFLDIEINGASGIDCAKIIADMEPKTKIVFATAHSEYMSEAFEVYAFDYLIKPFDIERVERTLDRILSLQEPEPLDHLDKIVRYERGLDRLLVKGRESMSFVDIQDIILVQRENNSTVIYTKQDSFTTSAGLGDIEAKLDPDVFLRSHKSYIINVSKIKKIEPYGRWTYIVAFKETYRSFSQISFTSRNRKSGLISPSSISDRVASPESTQTASTPAFLPVAISVYRRSPTMTASSGRQPVFFSTQSTMMGSGLPIKNGSFPVAFFSIMLMEPQSGIKPKLTGHTRSGLVARYTTSRPIMMQVLRIFSEVFSVSKPMRTMEAFSSGSVTTVRPLSRSSVTRERVPMQYTVCPG